MLAESGKGMGNFDGIQVSLKPPTFKIIPLS